MQQWQCNGDLNAQVFTLIPINSNNGIITYNIKTTTGLCLDIPSGEYKEGAAVQLWTCHDSSPHNEFTIQDTGSGVPPSFTIRPKADTRFCMDGGGSGTPTLLGYCNSQPRQTFTLLRDVPKKGCIKKSYGRGVGEPISSCRSGQEKNGALCYPNCPNGMYGVGEMIYVLG